MWDDLGPDRDHRSDDAKAFDLPLNAQGPTYFRCTSPEEGKGACRVALFLDYGINHHGIERPFALLSVLTKAGPASLRFGATGLVDVAGTLLDEIDRRRKLDVTIMSDGPAPSFDLVQHRLPISLPVDELDRLVRALFDAADSLEIYGRTQRMRPRNPDT
jgi:hypothetical protein